jgi:uncharacterized membrane protein
MLAKVRIASHPVHPMLVAFPIASYVATLAALIVYAAGRDPFWYRFAYIANAAGVATALLALIPGAIDLLLAVPRKTVARRTGIIHGLLNAVALFAFIINLAALHEHYSAGRPPMVVVPLVLASAGVLITLAAGFFGWEMVQRHHVGVLDRPDAVAVNDREAVAARWIQPGQPLVDRKVLAEPLDDDERARQAAWPNDRDSGAMPRH